jgi:hypothetical protein
MALKSPGEEEMRRVPALVHLLPPGLQAAFLPQPEVGVSLRWGDGGVTRGGVLGSASMPPAQFNSWDAHRLCKTFFTYWFPRARTLCSEEARGPDIMTAILEAAYCRQAIAQRKATSLQASSSEKLSSSGNSSGGGARRRRGVQQPSSTDTSSEHGGGSRVQGSNGMSHQAGPGELSKEVLAAISADAHRRAVQDAPAFIRSLTSAGWKVSTGIGGSATVCDLLSKHC